MAAKTRPTDFDLATFEKMTEPVSIRISRVDRATGSKMPLSMPQAEWSKPDARRIEDIVLKDLGGGGVYEAEMNGANNVGFKWKFHFPESLFPPKVMGMGPTQGPSNGTPDPSTAPAGTSWVPPYGGVAGQPTFLPQSAPVAPYTGFPQPQQRGSSSPMYYPQYGYGYTPPATSNGSSSKEDAMRAELDAMKQRATEAEHRREREAAEARHATELAELRRAIEANNASPKQDSQLEMLKLQMEADRQRHERERQEAKEAREEQRRQEDIRRQEALLARQEEQRRQEEERRRAEDLRREEMRAIEEQRRRDEDARRQIEEARRLAEQTAREASERKFELMMQMLQQQNSNNPMTTMLADVTRQLADSQREASLRAAEAPLKSMEMARMFKDMSGSDSLMKNIADAYNSAHGISMRGLEMVSSFMAQQQGGSPAWDIVSQGIGQAKEAFTDYVTSSKKAEMAQARAAQAQSQERAAAHQAQAAHAAAQAAAQAAAANPAMAAQAAQAQIEAQAAVTAAAQAAQAAQAATGEAEKAVSAKEEKEVELFGVTWPQVQQVRQFVAEQGETEATMKGVALGICTATIQLTENKITVPAFELVKEKRTFDLVDHLLPGASSEFIAQTAKLVEDVLAGGENALRALHEEVTGGEQGDPDDDDGDPDDDDDDDGDDDEDGDDE